VQGTNRRVGRGFLGTRLCRPRYQPVAFRDSILKENGMIRSLCTGIAAFALTAGAAFADDYPANNQDNTRPTVVVHRHSDPVVHVVRGGTIGAGVGALIGCLVTLPVCGPGAGVGAAIGGGSGAVIGAARTPDHDYYYRRAQREDYPPPQ
jgi:hypothetical protein